MSATAKTNILFRNLPPPHKASPLPGDRTEGVIDYAVPPLIAPASRPPPHGVDDPSRCTGRTRRRLLERPFAPPLRAVFTPVSPPPSTEPGSLCAGQTGLLAPFIALTDRFYYRNSDLSIIFSVKSPEISPAFQYALDISPLSRYNGGRWRGSPRLTRVPRHIDKRFGSGFSDDARCNHQAKALRLRQTQKPSLGRVAVFASIFFHMQGEFVSTQVESQCNRHAHPPFLKESEPNRPPFSMRRGKRALPPVFCRRDFFTPAPYAPRRTFHNF